MTVDTSALKKKGGVNTSALKPAVGGLKILQEGSAPISPNVGSNVFKLSFGDDLKTSIDTSALKIQQTPLSNKRFGFGPKQEDLPGGKLTAFGAATTIKFLDLISETFDFGAGLISDKTKERKELKGLSKQISENPLLEHWRNSFKQAGVNVESLSSKFKGFVDTLEQARAIQPTQKWLEADTKGKFSKENIGETLFQLGPSVVSSVGAYALNPFLGFAVASGATANDVKDMAISHGVDEDKAEKLGLATGLAVGWLDRIVPSRVFKGNLGLKNQFIGGFLKRLAESSVLEGGTEIAQEDLQILVEATFRDDLKFDEVATRNAMVGLGGVLGGAGMQTLASFSNKGQREEILGTLQKLPAGLSIEDVSGELQPLAKEAQKYSSAEEFVKTMKEYGMADEFRPFYRKGATKERAELYNFRREVKLNELLTPVAPKQWQEVGDTIVRFVEPDNNLYGIGKIKGVGKSKGALVIQEGQPPRIVIDKTIVGDELKKILSEEIEHALQYKNNPEFVLKDAAEVSIESGKRTKVFDPEAYRNNPAENIAKNLAEKRKGQIESQLTDIWNKANKVKPQEQKQALPQEALQEKTQESPKKQIDTSLKETIQQSFEERKAVIEAKEEMLSESPFASEANRFLVDKEGRIRELGDIKSKKLSQMIEDRIAESNIEDPTAFAEGVENYLEQKRALEEEKQELAEEERAMTKSIVSASKEDVFVEKGVNEKLKEQGFTLDILKDVAGTPKVKTLKDGTRIIDSDDLYALNTRTIKSTKDYKDFREYAIKNYQDKDIRASVTNLGHTSFTAERLAEMYDSGIGGRMYQEMIKPVYDSAAEMAKEADEISQEIRGFRILEGSKSDRDAVLFAEKKMDDAPKNVKEIAKYVRGLYDDFLVRMNDERKKIGVEPIPRRKDYITHLNELTILSEIFGTDRVSINERIRELKNEYIEEKGFEEDRAWEAAKRDVDGVTGINKYIDAKHPRFDFVKKRLGDFQKDPSIIRSLKAYAPQALRYIYQAENVAKNKAFKDVLPPNAKEFVRRWNTEQVAGRPNSGWLSHGAKKIIAPIRGTLGANTILGNAATMVMQLSSFPQVFSLAGVRNTFYGIGKRLTSYISGNNNFNQSNVKALRDLGIDMGLGDSIADSLVKQIGKFESLKNTAARTRQSIHFGRNILKILMEKFDQFTVGATYEAFYNQAIKQGRNTKDATQYAEIMTGKTQANYFKEALPPFLNSFEGRTVGQFGTYAMNQFQMFKRDFGKEFNLDEKSERSMRGFMKQFIVFLVAAYIVDELGEKTFGRQPYDIKELVDEIIDVTQGEGDANTLLAQARDTSFSYIPFLGSVKFSSMPPVFEFGKDAFNAVFGDDKKRELALREIQEKWAFSVLLPYGGNQLRKSSQGIETTTEIDFPWARDVGADKFEVKGNLEKAKAWFFGGYATEAAQDYFENQDRRDFIKKKYEIAGTITSDENIEKLKKMNEEEFEIYTATYAESTLKTINRKMGEESSIEVRSGNPFKRTVSPNNPFQ